MLRNIATLGCLLLAIQWSTLLAQPPAQQQQILRAQVKLSQAIQFETISNFDTSLVDHAAFLGLHKHLETSFPKVHRKLRREVINGYSLLYEWPGTAPDLKAVMLYAHMDVVPVEDIEGLVWEHPPFEGKIADGYLWGRGALDDKYRVIGILEAVERLLEAGWQPRRSIYLAFGHDEEINGWDGAHQIAQTLIARGKRLACVLDEGPAVLEDALPDVEQPVALVGMAEKGSLNLELIVEAPGGHSAMPPDQTAIGILARAIDRLQSKPFPARLIPLMEESLIELMPYLPSKYRIGLKNIWLFRKAVIKALDEDQVTSAVVRTKLSPTIISSGTRYNVLPKEARATLNIRLLQGDNIEFALAYVRETIDDERVRVEILGTPIEASPVSARDTEMFGFLKATIAERFPEAVIAPTLVPSGTDSKHFVGLSENLYRFLPAKISRAEGERLHSTNERIALESFENVIRFYALFLQKSS